SAGFAQKSELKALKKIYDKDALSAKDLTEFKSQLATVEPLIASASESDKTYLNFYKASLPLMELSTAEGKANANAVINKVTATDIMAFGNASAAVIAPEQKSGKKVLTDEIYKTISTLKPLLLSQAV